jgi:hypothetical protein
MNPADIYFVAQRLSRHKINIGTIAITAYRRRLGPPQRGSRTHGAALKAKPQRTRES